MPQYLFYILAAVAVFGAVLLVVLRNPVASALSMVLSFAAMAGLFVGLDAFMIGIVQILVYTGAIMVLFLFIVMLLDLGDESLRTRARKIFPTLSGIAAAALLVVQIVGVLGALGSKPLPPLDLAAAAKQFPADGRIAAELSPPAESERAARLPDIRLIARELFVRHNRDLQILGTILLVATVGTVVISRKSPPNEESAK
jgi:NADH-quinone oxidoreductase subunit J